jgi:hypothetical protein
MCAGGSSCVIVDVSDETSQGRSPPPRVGGRRNPSPVRRRSPVAKGAALCHVTCYFVFGALFACFTFMCAGGQLRHF